MSSDALPFSFSALLLAGGKSSRMGQDKAGLILEGKTLWRRQLDLLRELGAEEILVSQKSDGPCVDSRCKIVIDDPPSRGPLSGICAGLKGCSTEWLLVLAVDMPRMTPEFLRKLVSLAGHEQQGIVPKCAGRLHPLAAIYPRRCSKVAEECLRSDDWSMYQLVCRAGELSLVKEHEFSQEEKSLFANLNTPEDMRRFDRDTGCQP